MCTFAVSGPEGWEVLVPLASEGHNVERGKGEGEGRGKEENIWVRYLILSFHKNKHARICTCDKTCRDTSSYSLQKTKKYFSECGQLSSVFLWMEMISNFCFNCDDDIVIQFGSLWLKCLKGIEDTGHKLRAYYQSAEKEYYCGIGFEWLCIYL